MTEADRFVILDPFLDGRFFPPCAGHQREGVSRGRRTGPAFAARQAPHPIQDGIHAMTAPLLNRDHPPIWPRGREGNAPPDRCNLAHPPAPGLEARTLFIQQTDHPMKQQANLIRAGQVIEHEGRRWTVLKQQMITPGKGGAFIQVAMRDLKSGNKTNERWRTADTVERLTTEEKEFTYSYTDGTNLVLMDPETYEETHVPAAMPTTLHFRLPNFDSGTSSEI